MQDKQTNEIKHIHQLFSPCEDLAIQFKHEISHSYCKEDKKAMIRNRYSRIPHPALNTKRERDTYN